MALDYVSNTESCPVDGKLIQLKDPQTLPIFCNPYPIPFIHQKVFQQDLQHLIDEKVLQRIPRSEWAFPTFLIPKKDRQVH